MKTILSLDVVDKDKPLHQRNELTHEDRIRTKELCEQLSMWLKTFIDSSGPKPIMESPTALHHITVRKFADNSLRIIVLHELCDSLARWPIRVSRTYETQ
mmetsp:Transcript_57336/g.150990  ORF Transcript_57336/g.150990 Transcript_57336/m.150990 type:complete len:100 (+) Transcript_57336:98-397(+)